jgi:hypothetical protein
LAEFKGKHQRPSHTENQPENLGIGIGQYDKETTTVRPKELHQKNEKINRGRPEQKEVQTGIFGSCCIELRQNDPIHYGTNPKTTVNFQYNPRLSIRP